jgi:hypothetical protein
VFLPGVVVASLVLPGDRQATLEVIGYRHCLPSWCYSASRHTGLSPR